jgi:DNA-binding NtrC family response regulator
MSGCGDQGLDMKKVLDQDTEKLPQGSDLGTVLSISEAHLTVVEGPGAGLEVPCGERSVRIGSAPDNDLVIADSAVSRHHAVLEPSGGRLLVRDLGSTNGTFLADVQVREAYAMPECLMRMGKTTLRLHVKPRRVFIPPYPGDRFGALVGASHRMRQLFGLLSWVAPTETTVLITGPTGTGKEVVARSIHQASARARRPFVVLDCGAVDPGLIGSEVFGHEVGAFTGAMSKRIGVFEQGQGGTVFIDEVGELPLDLQPKLLRLLESRELRRLGSNQPVALDVRVLAATNRDLEGMVARKEFREDLYYRLCQVRVSLPSLSERREDIPQLVGAILERIKGKVRARAASKEALAFLAGCPLPGHVRQLVNVVERAAQVCRGPTLALEDLLVFEDEIRSSAAPGAGPGASGQAHVRSCVPEAARPLAEVEKETIIANLEAHRGNLARTARALGIAVNTLKARMHRHGIPRPDR